MHQTRSKVRAWGLKLLDSHLRYRIGVPIFVNLGQQQIFLNEKVLYENVILSNSLTQLDLW